MFSSLVPPSGDESDTEGDGGDILSCQPCTMRMDRMLQDKKPEDLRIWCSSKGSLAAYGCMTSVSGEKF